MRLTNTILNEPPDSTDTSEDTPAHAPETSLERQAEQKRGIGTNGTAPAKNGTARAGTQNDNDISYTEPDAAETAELQREAVHQIAHEQEIAAEARQDLVKEVIQERAITNGVGPKPVREHGYRAKLRRFIETSKTKKTPRLIMQIWQSDFSIIAFVLTMVSFYIMKDTGYSALGVLFFMLGMATVDSILSIFVVRLSFHQNKHGFYRTEDFERDWLRYKMLLSMTKTALLFVVATSCGTAAVVGAYVTWLFTATQRLRYIILRWTMDDHYPELQRWSIFLLLREIGIEPKLKNFNTVAIVGTVIGFAIAFIF